MAGVSMKDHIDRVEKQEGKLFTAVLYEIAKSGESKSATAELLDIPQTTFCAWVRRLDPHLSDFVGWPAKGKSNGFRGNVETNTPARKAARLQNLALTRTHKSFAV